MAFEINRILTEIERLCCQLAIVTNTTAFDTLQIGRLLADEHLQPLHYSRSCEYRWLYHTTSYYVGLWGAPIGRMSSVDWAAYDAWLAAEIDTICVCVPAKYDRTDPERDAFFIGVIGGGSTLTSMRRDNSRHECLLPNNFDCIEKIHLSWMDFSKI